MRKLLAILLLGLSSQALADVTGVITPPGGTGGGGGTVTSVSASVPAWESVSVGTPTTTPSIAITATTGLTANQVLATPSGATGAVSLRSITLTDICPACAPNQILFDNAGSIAGSAQFTWNDSTATLGLSSSHANTIQGTAPATGAGPSLTIAASGAGASGGGGQGGATNVNGGPPGTGAAGGAGGAVNITVPNATGSVNHNGNAISLFGGNGVNNAAGGSITGIAGTAGITATASNCGGRVQWGGGNGPAANDHGADVILNGGCQTSAGSGQLIGGDGVTDQGGPAQIIGGVALVASGQAGGDASSTGGAGDGVGRGGHSIMNTGAPGGSGVNGSLIFQINGTTIAQASGSGTSAGSISGWLIGVSSNATADHMGYQGTAPAVSACGTGPSIDVHATDKSGTVTVGTVAAASCTVTFASAYAAWDHCRVTSQSTIASFAYSYTLSVITVTGTSLVGDKFDYDCDGS